jgi:hypothetical protein
MPTSNDYKTLVPFNPAQNTCAEQHDSGLIVSRRDNDILRRNRISIALAVIILSIATQTYLGVSAAVQSRDLRERLAKTTATIKTAEAKLGRSLESINAYDGQWVLSKSIESYDTDTIDSNYSSRGMNRVVTIPDASDSNPGTSWTMPPEFSTTGVILGTQTSGTIPWYNLAPTPAAGQVLNVNSDGTFSWVPTGGQTLTGSDGQVMIDPPTISEVPGSHAKISNYTKLLIQQYGIDAIAKHLHVKPTHHWSRLCTILDLRSGKTYNGYTMLHRLAQTRTVPPGRPFNFVDRSNNERRLSLTRNR